MTEPERRYTVTPDGRRYAIVKTHRQRIYRALGAKNAAHAVAIGYNLGLLVKP